MAPSIMHCPVRGRSISIAIVCLLCVVFYTTPSPRLLLPNISHNPARPIEVARHLCHHVAVASIVSWHSDIYMSLPGVVSQELLCGDVRVYAPGPFPGNFQKVVDEVGLYHGPPADIETLFTDLDSTTLYPEENGSPMIDFLFLGTCESE